MRATLRNSDARDDCPTARRHRRVFLGNESWNDEDIKHLRSCHHCRQHQLDLLRSLHGDLRGLIADDEDTARRLIPRFLKDLHSELVTVGDGENAFQRATEALRHNRPFDFFILDDKMPHMNGVRVAEKLRHSGYETPPILLVTGWETDETLERQCAANRVVMLEKSKTRLLLARNLEMALLGLPVQDSLAG